VFEFLISDPSNHEMCFTASNLIQNLIEEQMKNFKLTPQVGLKIVRQLMAVIGLHTSPSSNSSTLYCQVIGAVLVVSKKFLSDQKDKGNDMALLQTCGEEEDWIGVMTCAIHVLRTTLQSGDEMSARSLLAILATLGNGACKNDFMFLIYPQIEE
jgi:hypothetical protein